MGIRRVLTRQAPPAAEHVRTDQSGLMAIFGINTGESFDVFGSGPLYGGGMAIPAAWRASTLIADAIGQVPWDAYRNPSGVEAPIKIDPRPRILEDPSPPATRMTVLTGLALDYIWHGNAIAIITSRNAIGLPTSYLPVPAEYVMVRYTVGGFPFALVPPGAVEYRIGQYTFTPDEVIHVKGPCAPGALRGIGVLEAHLATLRLAREQSRQASNVAQNGVPTSVLKSTNPDLTRADAAALKTAWLAAQRDRTVAVLNATTEFQAVAWRPDEMQMVEGRKFTIQEMELIFGMPVGWLGGEGPALRYINMAQDDLNLAKYTLNGHFVRFEQELARHFPYGTCVEADLGALLRSDTLTRYQGYAIATGGQGWLTADDIRAKEGDPPLPKDPSLPVVAAPAAAIPGPPASAPGPTPKNPSAPAPWEGGPQA